MDIRNRIILLVEDDLKQAEMIKEMVESIGHYEVVHAKDGYEGLMQVRKHGRFMGFAGNRISCILLDMRMPNMNGVEFVKKLRKREKWRLFERYCPVIFLTAYEEEEYFTAAMNQYACRYLTKPVEQEELIAALKLVIEDYDYYSAVESTRDKMWENIKDIQQKNKSKKQAEDES